MAKKRYLVTVVYMHQGFVEAENLKDAYDVAERKVVPNVTGRDMCNWYVRGVEKKQ